MAIKLEKDVQRFIKSYPTDNGPQWKISIPDGSGGQIRKQGFLDKSDAVEFSIKEYLKILTQTKGVKSVSASKTTFGEYSTQWLELKKREGISYAAFMRYKQEIDIRLIPYFGRFKISEIEKSHLRNYIYDLQSEGNGSSIVQYSVKVFKGILKKAEIDDLVLTKGITQIPTPRHKKKDPIFWDHKQINFFLNATKGHRFYGLWKATLFTGMRAGEIAGLKWDCVYFDKSFGSYTGAIEVKRTYNQKTRQIQETTKNGDKRVIPIFPEIRSLLEELYNQKNGPFVFGGMEPLESSHFNRQLKSALKKLKCDHLPTVSFHGLRHSFCSYLDSTGMSRRVVAEIMGHRDLNTTNRYSHVNNQMLGNEVERWLKTQAQQKSSNLEVVSF